MLSIVKHVAHHAHAIEARPNCCLENGPTTVSTRTSQKDLKCLPNHFDAIAMEIMKKTV